MTAAVAILALAFLQNVTFSIVSRSRNRDHRWFHVSASLLSNVTWFLTFKQLLAVELSWAIFPAYISGTTLGSEWGRVISMRIERALFARSDAHVEAKESGMTKEIVDGQRVYYCDFCGAEFHNPVECRHHEEACRSLDEEP